MGSFQIGLSDDYLNRLVADIVSAVPTDEVYIFGSYARGEEAEGSDIDIYVVTSDAEEKPLEYGKRVRLALPWINPWTASGFPKDLDVVTSSAPVFSERAANLANLEHLVQKEGVKIYG